MSKTQIIQKPCARHHCHTWSIIGWRRTYL